MPSHLYTYALCIGHCCYSHFRDEKTEAQGLRNLSAIKQWSCDETQQTDSRAGFFGHASQTNHTMFLGQSAYRWEVLTFLLRAGLMLRNACGSVALLAGVMSVWRVECT
jgi:hypothetical protein